MIKLVMAHPPASKLKLSPTDKPILEEISSSPSRPHREVRQAKGLLMAADGMANMTIADTLGVSRSTVIAWRKHFDINGVNDIGKVSPGRGRKPSIPTEVIEKVVRETQQTIPLNATQWSVRTMAAHVGISKSKVQQIWASRGLKPHLVKTFKL